MTMRPSDRLDRASARTRRERTRAQRSAGSRADAASAGSCRSSSSPPATTRASSCRRSGRQLLVPLIGIVVLPGAVGAARAAGETSLGAIPGPAQVWEQAASLGRSCRRAREGGGVLRAAGGAQRRADRRRPRRRGQVAAPTPASRPSSTRSSPPSRPCSSASCSRRWSRCRSASLCGLSRDVQRARSIRWSRSSSRSRRSPGCRSSPWSSPRSTCDDPTHCRSRFVDLGDHGDALLAVADADQHRARRRLDRQGPDQCRPRAAAVDWTHQITKLVLPSALPLIFTGLRLSLGVGWMVLIAAEMLAQNPGLGKFVWDEFQNGSSQVARPDHGRGADHRPHRLPARPRHVGAAGRRHLLGHALSGSRQWPSSSSSGVSKALRRRRGAHATCSSGIDLEVEEGEFVAILGFSGSGKTTLISLIAGLIEPDEGEVLFKGKPIDGPGPERGVVFQSYSLMPWLTVEGNVALAVDAVFARSRRPSAQALVDQTTSSMVGLGHAARPQAGGAFRRHAPARRGGARAGDGARSPAARRAALGARRADPRQAAGRDRARSGRRTKTTIVLITNDVDEAILLADRIIPLKPGPAHARAGSSRSDLPRPRDRDGAERRRRPSSGCAPRSPHYLMDAGAAATAASDGGIAAAQRRAVSPDARLPAAYREAAPSAIASDRYLEF